MFKKRSKFIPLVFLSVALTLSGCGGSGGNSNESDAPPEENQASSSITTENAIYQAAVAFAAVSAARGMPIDFGALVGSSSGDDSNDFVYWDFVVTQFQILKNQIQSASASTAARPLDCAMHVSGDISPELNFVVGDTVTFDFDTCTYGTDLVVNKVIGINVTHVVGNNLLLAPYEVGLEITPADLTVTSGGREYVANGKINTLINDQGNGERLINLDGESLSATISGDIISPTLNLTNYAIALTENVSGAYTIALDGAAQMSIPFVNVNITFTTITPFSGNTGVYEGRPTAGQLRLTGTDGSNAWVTPQPDGENIEISVDVTRDGNPDATIMTTWSDLQRIVAMDIGL
jgi:hypothetical protein